MKNIFVQNNYNKFINNLQNITIPNFNFYFNKVENNLHKLFFTLNLTDYIFCSSGINDEVISFIKDNEEKNINIYIYHDIYNEYLTKIIPKAKHIIDEEHYTDFGVKLSNNIINTDLYYNDKNIVKKNQIIVFLEKQTAIPEAIKEKLYPDGMNVLMFNSSSIQNDQNIGFLLESDRADILRKSLYFACDADYYGIEAKLCGCEILNIHNLDDNISNKYDTTNYIEYREYVRDTLS